MREDKDEEFRKKLFEKYNNKCCYSINFIKSQFTELSLIIDKFAMSQNLVDEEKNIVCSNANDLKIVHKDLDVNNNKEDNLLVVCKHHYNNIFYFKSKKKDKENRMMGIKKQKKLPDYLTKEEFERFLEQIELGNYKKYSLLFQIMFYTGGRIGEVLQLRKKDIDLIKKEINFKAETTKAKKQRIAHLPEKIINELSDKLKDLNEEDILYNISQQYVWKMVKIYTKLANIDKKIKPHSFRHSFTTILYDKSNDIKLVQEALGHSSTSITGLYIHVDEKKKKELINSSFD